MEADSSNLGKSLKKRSIIRSAAAVSAGTMTSRILGFARDALLLAFFDRSVTDAFVVAFRLPNLFRRLFGEGMLSVVLVPALVNEFEKGDERARSLARALFGVLWMAAAALAVLAFVFMKPLIVFWLGDPVGSSSGNLALTILFAQIMLVYLVLVTTYASLTAMAQALQRFFWPAVAPAFFNLAVIAAIILGYSFGRPHWLAWGVAVGGVLQVAVVGLLLWRMGAWPGFSVNWADPRLKDIFRRMLPAFFGIGFYQLLILINTRLAAPLSAGAQSYLYAADRIVELPQALIAISLGSALLPHYAELLSARNRRAFLSEAAASLRLLLFLAIPCAIGLFCLAEPIIRVLFEHGAFHAAAAGWTAQIVRIYSLFLLFAAVAKVLAPSFYAMNDAVSPALAAGGGLLVQLVAGTWAASRFGLPGIAAITVVSVFLNTAILIGLFYARIGGLELAAMLSSLLRQTPGVLALTAICGWGYPMLSGMLPNAMALALVIISSMAVYFAGGLLCGSFEADRLIGRFFRRLPQ